MTTSLTKRSMAEKSKIVKEFNSCSIVTLRTSDRSSWSKILLDCPSKGNGKVGFFSRLDTGFLQYFIYFAVKILISLN